MRVTFRTDEEEPHRHLILAPDSPEERGFCRELISFFRAHDR